MPTNPPSAPPIRLPDESPQTARIKVVGVGGGGSNAIDRMIDFGVEGVEFIALNTDVQALEVSKAPVRGQLGSLLTYGLSAGSDPDVGRRAAIQDVAEIAEVLEGADMVFITAGLGGGTGTGAAPVIAAIASEMGALTVAIVTRPFNFEGKRRMAIAEWGIEQLLRYVDTLIVIPNEKLLNIAKDAPFFESFKIADDFLRQAVQGISDIITTEGVINRDFADVKTTMAGMGYAVMGTASRSGPTRAVDAVMDAMASPLLEEGAIDGARGILINITGSSTLRLSEVNAASRVIQSVAHEDANIIFGAVLDERLGDEVKATVIATGFRNDGRDRSARRASLLRAATAEPPKADPEALESMQQENPALAAAEQKIPVQETPAQEGPEQEAPTLEAWIPEVSEPLHAPPQAELASAPAEQTGREIPLTTHQVQSTHEVQSNHEMQSTHQVQSEAIYGLFPDSIEAEVEAIHTVAVEQLQTDFSEAIERKPEAETVEAQKPEAVPELVAEIVPEEVRETVPDAAPEAVLETVPEEVPETIPDQPESAYEQLQPSPPQLEGERAHDLPQHHPLESDELDPAPLEAIEQPRSELGDEEDDWREVIREIARLAEPAFDIQAEPSFDTQPPAFDMEADDERTPPASARRPAIPSAPPTELVPVAPVHLPMSPQLSPTRRAALAAYAAVSSPEAEADADTEMEEPEAKPVNAFAQVLEARRRFVESLGASAAAASVAPTLAASVETSVPPSSPPPSPQRQLENRVSYQDQATQHHSSLEPQADPLHDRPIRASRPRTIDAEPSPIAETVLASRKDLYSRSNAPSFTDAAPSQPRGDDPSRPLSDRDARPPREEEEQRNQQPLHGNWNPKIPVPSFGSLSERKSHTDKE